MNRKQPGSSAGACVSILTLRKLLFCKCKNAFIAEWLHKCQFFVAVTGARGEEEDEEEERGPREEGGEGLTEGLLRRTKSLITLKVNGEKKGHFASRREESEGFQIIFRENDTPFLFPSCRGRKESIG